MSQIQENDISIYQFSEEEDHPHQSIMSKLPFCVVGSNTVVTNSVGVRVRGRRYPWGTVNIEDQVCNSGQSTTVLSHLASAIVKREIEQIENHMFPNNDL